MWHVNKKLKEGDYVLISVTLFAGEKKFRAVFKWDPEIEISDSIVMESVIEYFKNIFDGNPNYSQINNMRGVVFDVWEKGKFTVFDGKTSAEKF